MESGQAAPVSQYIRDISSDPVDTGFISIYAGAPVSHESTPCVCPLLSPFLGHQTRGRSTGGGVERPALGCGPQSLVSALGDA